MRNFCIVPTCVVGSSVQSQKIHQFSELHFLRFVEENWINQEYIHGSSGLFECYESLAWKKNSWILQRLHIKFISGKIALKGPQKPYVQAQIRSEFYDKISNQERRNSSTW